MQKLIELEVEGQQVVLFPGATMSFEWSNPIFSEDVVPGSFSLPFDLPAGPNGLVFGFPELVANTANARKEYSCTLRSEGEEIKGLLKLRKVTAEKYTVNIQIGYSAFGEALKSKSLRKFEYGGERVMGADLSGVLNHMLDTTRRPEDFDYVFAPVHNPSLYGDKNPGFGGVVNRYNMNDYAAMNPAGGSLDWFDNDGNQIYSHFAYNYAFSVIGSSGSTVNSICPFPKLKYVLEQVVSELGVMLQQDFFDEELSTLYVLSNTALDKIRYTQNGGNNDYSRSFFMKDLMPDMTFSQLLQALKDTFALSVQVGLDKVVSIRKLKDLLENTAYQDLTPYTAPGHEIPIEDPAPVTLKYRLDDDLSSDRVKEFDEEARILEPVETPADLEALNYTGPAPEHNDVRFVTSLKQYYRYSLLEEPIGWGFYCEDYLPLDVAGGGEDVEQGIALTMDASWIFEPVPDDPSQDETLKLPAYGVEGYSRPFMVVNLPKVLRLAFYRGYQPIKEEKASRLYPLLSGDNLNAKGEMVGNYSLRLDGEAGTYSMFMKDWVELKVNPRVVNRQLYMNMVQLKKIDFNQKANIDGNRFLVKKLKFTLPITKPVLAELVQVKK